MPMTGGKIFLVERINSSNKIEVVCFCTSVKQLYLFLELRHKTAKQEMPFKYGALQQRMFRLDRNKPIWLTEKPRYRITKVGEHKISRKSIEDIK